jgi:DNA polymerase III gamma/tau subunit
MKEQAELFSREDLVRLFDALLETEGELRYATQMRFHLEMGLIKLAEISKMRSLEDLIAEFRRLVENPNPPSGGPGRAGTPPPKLREVKPASGPAERKERETSEDRPGGGDRSLVEDIASAVQRESLVSILQAVPTAELKEDTVTFELTPVSEFYRRQIRDNLPSIIEAASSAVGRPVRVVLSDGTARAPERPQAAAPQSDVLERAKKEPIVQSFLETFPGPVTGEEME